MITGPDSITLNSPVELSLIGSGALIGPCTLALPASYQQCKAWSDRCFCKNRYKTKLGLMLILTLNKRNVVRVFQVPSSPHLNAVSHILRDSV